jgi:hypothetical protein
VIEEQSTHEELQFLIFSAVWHILNALPGGHLQVVYPLWMKITASLGVESRETEGKGLRQERLGRSRFEYTCVLVQVNRNRNGDQV